jgi:hypothetical protein
LGDGVADQSVPHGQRFVSKVKRLAERDHPRTADDVAQRSQVCVTVSIVVYRNDSVRVLAGPLLEGLGRGVLPIDGGRVGKQQQDEMVRSNS